MHNRHRHQQRFRASALEGLRGIAAIAIAAYALGRFVHWSAAPIAFFKHIYLADTFFYCLSGFVMARAYGGRLAEGTLPLKKLCWHRASRLLPLVVIVAVASFIIRLTLVSSGGPVFEDTAGHLLRALPSSILSLKEDYTDGLVVPLNPCASFLCRDLLSSFVWALFVTRMHLWTVLSAVIVFLAILVDASAMNMLGIHSAYGASWPMLLSLIKAIVSFLLGAAVWQFSQGKTDGLFYAEILMTLLWTMLWIPVDSDIIYDLACALILFPVMILFGAEATTLITRPILLNFLGGISYSLIAIHALNLSLTVKAAEYYPFLLEPAGMPLVLLTWAGTAWFVAAQIERPLTYWIREKMESW